MKHIGMIGVALILLVSVAPVAEVPVAEAHQPYCEDSDVGPTTPFRISDPTVSTAFYATLFPDDDIDYLAFRGEADQQILFGMTIPQIDGQADFAPTFALFGPGLTQSDLTLLPDAIQPPRDATFEIFSPGDEAPDSFYEPFSGTSYWNRQEAVVTLPEDGHYTVAVWHDAGVYGRYVMVVGNREVLGGDLGCLMSLDDYFSPVDAEAEMMRDGDGHDDDHADSDHDSAKGEHNHDDAHK